MHTLLRVENPETRIGLWYNEDGERTDFIKTIPDAQSAELPMDFDPFFKDGGDWVSACDELEKMKQWFSDNDLRQLSTHGFHLYAFVVPSYRITSGPISHAVFRREDIITTDKLDIRILAPNA